MDKDSIEYRCAVHLKTSLESALHENNSVLWLVSGGSAIRVAVLARNLLGRISGKNRLHLALVDERFGPVGHEDSNYKKLLDEGFKDDQVILHPVLQANQTIAETTARYNQCLKDLLDECGKFIGLFGIGADGHTAGIFPDSSLVEENQKLVGSYQGADFQRISISPLMIRRGNEAILYAVGRDKWPALKQFYEDGPNQDIPARILKTAKAYSVYTDYK